MRDTIDAAARDGRAAAAPSRAVPAARRRSAQGRAAPRPARHRQDAARARGRQRERGASSSTSPGPEIMGSAYGESERRLREIFEQAAQGRAVDHLHRRDRFDRAQARPGHRRGREAAGRPAADPAGRDGAARRTPWSSPRPTGPRRSTRRCAVPAASTARSSSACPTSRGRREILGIHTRGMPLGDGRRSRRAGAHAPTASSAPISPRLTREAAIEAVRRIMPQAQPRRGRRSRPRCSTRCRSTRKDFDNALKRVQPSAMREVMVEAPTVRWDDIGGLDEARDRLREGVELPLKHPDAFRRLGIRPAKGFLLYGPPGTGKTLLAKAAARESEANFIATKSSDLLSANGMARASSRSPGCSPARARSRRRSSSSTSSTAWCPRAAAGSASRRSPSAWSTRSSPRWTGSRSCRTSS